MSSEEWRPVGDWPYEVSNMGRVRRTETGHVLSPRDRQGKGTGSVGPDGSRYQSVWLSDGDRSRNFSIHQLVAAAFLGPRPMHHEPHHKNRNREDNRASNLEYIPRKQNRGAQLSDEKVREIRRRYREEDITQRELADEYGIGRQTVTHFVNHTSRKSA